MDKSLISFCKFLIATLIISFSSVAMAASEITSIAYGFNIGNQKYYYYAEKGNDLYYMNKDSKWVRISEFESHPPKPGPIAVAFEKKGGVDIYMLSGDGNLYSLRYKESETNPMWYWDRASDVKPLEPTQIASSLTYFYDHKKDAWYNSALIDGKYYLLSSNDNQKTWYWKETPTVPSLKPNSTIAEAADPTDGSVAVYAMEDGKLMLLKTRDDGKTFFWDPLSVIDTPLQPDTASISYFYDKDNNFSMFALQGVNEYELKISSDGKKWSWVPTSTSLTNNNIVEETPESTKSNASTTNDTTTKTKSPID